jgi:hypothetical protein
MPALTGWHFNLFIFEYYFTGATGAVEVGAFSAGVFVLAGAGASVVSIILESESLNEPVKLKLDNKINAINTDANVHVLLSKKSVVF